MAADANQTKAMTTNAYVFSFKDPNYTAYFATNACGEIDIPACRGRTLEELVRHTSNLSLTFCIPPLDVIVAAKAKLEPAHGIKPITQKEFEQLFRITGYRLFSAQPISAPRLKA